MQIDSHVLGLGGEDSILGVEWLRTLGDVMVNWKEMQMKFNVGS